MATIPSTLAFKVPLEDRRGKNLHLEPADDAGHGTELKVSGQFIHGIEDVDAVRVQTQMVPPAGARKPNASYAAYRRVLFEDMHFGSVWRTPAGRAKELHVDRIQALGIRLEKADVGRVDPAKYPTSYHFRRCRWSNDGKPMPGGYTYVDDPRLYLTNALGYTNGDTCLIQEGVTPEIIFEDCDFAPGLQPVKISTRVAWNSTPIIRVINTPNFTLYVEGLNISQFGIIEVLDSPNFRLQDAKNLGLAALIRPKPREELARMVANAEAAVSSVELQLGDLKKNLAKMKAAI